MRKTAALLFAGLVMAQGVYAAQKSAPSPGSPGPSPQQSQQIDTRKLRAGDDYLTLNFTNIDITALVKVMSELTHRNFILDERVTGKVTLMTPTKISPAEAYQVFLSALEMKGFTAIEEDKITRIIPANTARQSGLKVYKDGDFDGQGFVTKLIRLTYVNPNELVRTLTPLVSRDGGMIAYPATNSLILTDAVPNVRKIESLVQALDVPPTEGKGKINVYYLKHANAEDFAKVMAALVSRLPTPPAGGVAPAGPATILEGQVTITADKATNSLIIVASPGDYETIRGVIEKLDIRRRQVYVEAAIIEMSLSKQRELGFEFQAANLNNLENANKTTTVGGTNFGNIGNAVANGPAALAAMNGLTVGAVKGTFTFRGQEFLSIGALLHALQSDGDVNVLSTPNILTTDNQKAEIMVGENVPFVTGQSQSAATGGGSILTSIDRRDVGISLKLTPQITSDDNVKLDLYQEISDITVTPGLNPNIVGPTTSKRSASTTVVVKDRQTVVIGGLIRDNLTSSESKVPLLGDIPILGWLFKYKTTQIEKTNLMIFITPYIIKNEEDAAQITQKKGEGLEQFRKEYGLEKKKQEPAALTGVPAYQQKAVQPETEQTIPGVESAPTNSMNNVQSAPTSTGSEASQNNTSIQSAPTGTVSGSSASTSSGQPAPANKATGPSQTGASVQSGPTGTVSESSASTSSGQPASANKATGSSQTGASVQSGPSGTAGGSSSTGGSIQSSPSGSAGNKVYFAPLGSGAPGGGSR